jgi:predicted nucleotidyltransferase
MDKREVIEKVEQYSALLKKYFEVDAVYLFGSFAKGTQHTDSDIDVAVVLKDTTEDFFSTTPLLWKLRREIDDRIEPILIDKRDDVSGFWEEIVRTGIKVR